MNDLKPEQGTPVPDQENPLFASWKRPTDKSLLEWIETRVSRKKTRQYDWNALGWQADVNPLYRRAQTRYIGTGAAGVQHDANVIPAEHFTFSTMILPAGCEGPLHVHHDVEEAFFILRGDAVRLFLEYQGERCELVLNERDVISVPPGVYRGLRNEGQEEALMCVMLGANRPDLPEYPADHPLTAAKKARAQAAAVVKS
ncbi:cupin domain-containing protein [Paenalcaligenes niemegkensis]|uniref:cupin domain-containing protein n=1 Tax=Paenalcaligenes niemegkensis TaxID=2895469 RepID=UPI001EE958DC|nr:cupin domain-containing protein [Paenalcaligenes niemegkensis]MCQ9617565.1 cupin domain-containing protein [Paenalcaligenes niemegkensis]